MVSGQQVGPFTVERELGSGAMGAVYLARYKDGKRVALKFMSPSLGSNDKAMARFAREAEILKQLRHPNIVRLFGHGKHAKMPYYAMEFIEGESIDKVLARRGRLPWEEVVQLGRQLATALQHAHEKGIIHRDLKPSNLMLLKDGTLKLTDFGIARDLDVTRLTSANCTVGTAAYMSPEQCKGEANLSHKSDLYSLGVVFYELLTGQKPFEADNVMELFLKHVKEKPERPSRLVLDIPPWLDTLVCQLLEKTPEKRPFDAAVVGTALEQVVEKVTAQRSAGVEAVTSPVHARLGATRADAEDRQAARTLLEGLGKGKKKRKCPPFYTRAWFKALGIGAALVGVGALLVIALMPPSPDSLYADAKRLMESGDPARKERARDEPIARYLRYHRKRQQGTEQLKQIEAWRDEVDVERHERALHNRMRVTPLMSPEHQTEAMARNALKNEEDGDIAEAAAKWQELLKEKDADDRDMRLYGLVAEKHLRELGAAEDRWLALNRKVDLALAGQDFNPESEAEAAAAEALRYEKFGDRTLAYRRWQGLRLRMDRDAADRTWYLLAAQRAQELKTNKPTSPEEEEQQRLDLINKKLAAAEQLAMSGDRVRALLIGYEIRLLYGKNTELAKQLAAADELIKKYGGRSP
jgi:serine/threonine-protein kinase